MSHLALVLALAAAAPLSSSKLGVVASANDASTDSALASSPCPRLAVFPVPGDGSAAAQIAAYRANCPGGTAIARVGNPGLAVDATTVTTLGPGWMVQLAALNAVLDGVEGPSEPTAVSSDVLAQFWSSFADLVNANGLRPVVGAVTAASALGGGGATDTFCATATAMQGKVYDWWWSFHARSPLTRDLASEATPTFGYRQIRSDCILAARTVVVSEAGPARLSWQPGDGPWLAFLDAELAKDSFVLGAALAPGFTPVLADLLAALGPAPDAGAPDGGSRDAGAGGVVPPSGAAPGGPLQPVNTKGGCATGGAAAALAALVPALLALRRRRQVPGVKR